MCFEGFGVKFLAWQYFAQKLLKRLYWAVFAEEYLFEWLGIGVMYLSCYEDIAGVPGIGKTLCVKQVAMKVCKER